MYWNDTLICKKESGQLYVEAVCWVLKQLRKHGLFVHLKKYRFHQEKVCLLSSVVSAPGVQLEDERIEAVKAWPEPKSVRDIQVLIGFANFYRRFI